MTIPVPLGGVVLQGQTPSTGGPVISVPPRAVALTGLLPTLARAILMPVGTVVLTGKQVAVGGPVLLAMPRGSVTYTGYVIDITAPIGHQVFPGGLDVFPIGIPGGTDYDAAGYPAGTTALATLTGGLSDLTPSIVAGTSALASASAGLGVIMPNAVGNAAGGVDVFATATAGLDDVR
jgi:hypothetical protein